MSQTILVTGGAGFIGSNFVSYIMENYPDYRLMVLDTLTYAGSVDNLPKSIFAVEDPKRRFWYGDVCNADLVNSLVSEADIVVHFAAETHVTKSIYDNKLFFQTDVLGTHTVSNAILTHRDKVKRFIHISTSEVYGTARSDSMGEEHPLMPMSPYASAKCGADRLVYSYWETYKIPAVILRPFNNYGPRQHLEKLIPRFITSTILEQGLTVHGRGDARRDFVHVNDTCRAIDAVINAENDQVHGQVFNVSSGIDRSVLEIAENIIGLTKAKQSPVTFIGDRLGQVVRHTGDYSKIERTLGWKPEIDWNTGLQSTLEWYKENREWWEKQLWMRSIPIITESGTTEHH